MALRRRHIDEDYTPEQRIKRNVYRGAFGLIGFGILWAVITSFIPIQEKTVLEFPLMRYMIRLGISGACLVVGLLILLLPDIAHSVAATVAAFFRRRG